MGRVSLNAIRTIGQLDDDDGTAATKLVALRSLGGVVMHKRLVVLLLAVAISTGLAIRLAGQAAAPERQLVTRAADALGGRDSWTLPMRVTPSVKRNGRS